MSFLFVKCMHHWFTKLEHIFMLMIKIKHWIEIGWSFIYYIYNHICVLTFKFTKFENLNMFLNMDYFYQGYNVS